MPAIPQIPAPLRRLARGLAPAGSAAVTVIEPPRRQLGIHWRELWEYRELFGYFVWRDLKVRYRQTALGAAWAILVPFIQMVVFSVLFGAVLHVSTDGLPKPVFYYAALIPWTYFSNALSMAAASFLGNAHFLTKVYFPRLIIPASCCLANLVDLAIALVLLLAMMPFYRIMPTLTVLLLPLFLAVALLTAFGAGLLLASVSVRYRDFRYVVPFLIQVWMYCSVIVPFSTVLRKFGPWAWLYGLNPIVGVVEGFRWCLLRRAMAAGPDLAAADPAAPWLLLLIGLPVAVALVALGLYSFRRMESAFADII